MLKIWNFIADNWNHRTKNIEEYVQHMNGNDSRNFNILHFLLFITQHRHSHHHNRRRRLPIHVYTKKAVHNFRHGNK